MTAFLNLVKRNFKEIMRDPLSLIFCLGFPIVMLFIMQLIFTNVDAGDGVYQFNIVYYSSGIAVFGYAFMGLFCALQLTTDKSGAFLTRILVAPVSPFVLFFSYVAAALPLCFGQTIIFMLLSMIWMGEAISIGILVSFFYLIPSMLVMISLGLLVGSLCRLPQQAGPLSSIIVTASGLLGDIWMPINLPGMEGFKIFCTCLPFYPAVQLGRAAITQNYGAIYPYVLIVLAWTLVCFVAATLIFKKNTKN